MGQDAKGAVRTGLPPRTASAPLEVVLGASRAKSAEGATAAPAATADVFRKPRRLSWSPCIGSLLQKAMGPIPLTCGERGYSFPDGERTRTRFPRKARRTPERTAGASPW